MRRPEWCPKPTWARFWLKVIKPTTGMFVPDMGNPECWPWTGAFNRPSKRRTRAGGDGTPRPVFAWAHNCKVYAHRLALALYDSIPLWEREGLDCHHSCENRACVNPRHLQWLTKAEHDNLPTRPPRDLSLDGSGAPTSDDQGFEASTPSSPV